jgi:hypothetical protein
LDGDDEPLPPGLVLVSDDGEVEGMVGRDGFTQLSGALDQRRYLSAEHGEARFVCAVPAADPADPLSHLGDVRCAD